MVAGRQTRRLHRMAHPEFEGHLPVVPASGGSPMLLAAGDYHESRSWSPDGKSIAYSDYPMPDGHLYFLNLESREAAGGARLAGLLRLPFVARQGTTWRRCLTDFRKVALFDIREAAAGRSSMNQQDENSHPAFSH